MTQETNDVHSNCYIGIGSNLDNPLKHVQDAIAELQQLENCTWIGASSLYRSEPVGPAGQEDYINAVACFTSTLAPEQLLDALQAIENKHQRVRIERWGSRTLDLDILLIADLTINSTRLSVPHPYIDQRNFVLIPLKELNENLLVKGSTITELLKECPAGDLEKLSL
jgi:2-amino-4-hydroxy-6-hydroxymethyldihydropteridine diphosphokinase